MEGRKEGRSFRGLALAFGAFVLPTSGSLVRWRVVACAEGFFQVPSNIPPWFIWAYYIGFHTYTFEMFMYNEFHDQRVDCDVPVSYTSTGTPICRFADGNAVLKLYDMENVRLWLDIVVLLINIVGYRFVRLPASALCCCSPLSAFISICRIHSHLLFELSRCWMTDLLPGSQM